MIAFLNVIFQEVALKEKLTTSGRTIRKRITVGEATVGIVTTVLSHMIAIGGVASCDKHMFGSSNKGVRLLSTCCLTMISFTPASVIE